MEQNLIACTLKYAPLYQRGGVLQLLQIIVEVMVDVNVVSEEHWTHLERVGGPCAEISSTTFDGVAADSGRYVQCVGQVRMADGPGDCHSQEEAFRFLLERYCEEENGQPLASFTCGVVLDVHGTLSLVEVHNRSSCSVTVVRI
jgi:hypothetical protein